MTRIWWCQEHDSGLTAAADVVGSLLYCHEAMFYRDFNCRMVPMRLIPDNAEPVWFCNSTFMPRCREAQPDPMGLGGHDSCQWVYIIPTEAP